MSEPETITTWSHDSSAGGTVWLEGDGDRIRVWEEAEPGPQAATLTDAVRDAAWTEIQIPRNPLWALYRQAVKRGLGAPLTHEFDFPYGDKVYRGQGYAMGIVYAEVGKWDRVWVVLW